MGPVPECATLCMPAETVGDIRKDSSFRTVTGSSPGRACGERWLGVEGGQTMYLAEWQHLSVEAL